MKMFFDVSCLDNDSITGIGTYTKNLFYHLRTISDYSIYPMCSANRLVHRQRIEKHLPCKVTSSLIVPYLPFELKLLHSPDHRQISIPAHIKIQTIHDTAMLEDADYAESAFQKKFKKRFDVICNDSSIDQFITVSHYTKNRLVHFYPHLKNKIQVVHSGANHIFKSMASNPYPWPYLLSVGTLENRKNTLGLLKAFEFVGKEFSELRLLIFGKEGYGSKHILEYLDRHPFKDRIHWKNYVTNNTLATAYRYAEMLIYPSFYEGFGLPVVEAMRFRCPVVCSDIPSLKEIGQDAVMTFNPRDCVEMAERIKSVYLNATDRFMLKSLGDEQSQKFTWQLAAKKTWSVYMDQLRQRLNEGLPDPVWEEALFSY